MNKEIIKIISANLGVKDSQVEATLTLLQAGNTIPFIARYRKEVTGSLDEEQIRAINDVYQYQLNLLERKNDVIRLISEKGLMTDDLKLKINEATKLVEVEDLYRPYKEKKHTKATDAMALGLEPLAKLIMTFPITGDLNLMVEPYLNEQVTKAKAIEGAKYIISEMISDNANYRKWIRRKFYSEGIMTSKVKKQATDPNKTYEMYYDYKEAVRQIKAHRILALNRGEREKVLTVNIELDDNIIITYLTTEIIKGESIVNDLVKEAISDAYNRLIAPSVIRELRADLTLKASEVAVDNFGKNLEKLLLQPPMKGKVVLGFDPAFRTGCKLAVIDETGQKIWIDVIYPHEPQNKVAEAELKLIELINKYKVDIVAIGNGTASRESEQLIADTIKKVDHKVEYLLVSEAGASVYSASPLAIAEFPDLTVEKRSAISIGRRLQDPLSELVKIDPKSIGVGLYQHDIANKLLTESLDFVVSKAVNAVGVNVNTASESLLKYVSGLTKKSINSILTYRLKHGRINDREELKTILTPQTYEQAIGFLRIIDGINPLDRTAIHPESYGIAKALLTKLNFTLADLGTPALNESLKTIDLKALALELKTDTYTLDDIVKSLAKPNRDPRDQMPKPLLRSDILSLDDLTVGLKLQGTVRNVVDFGAFVDIGLHEDGLIHISKMSNHYLKHPSDLLSVGDIIDCYVIAIDKTKKRVSLSLLEPKN